jgi:hypothetical protein
MKKKKFILLTALLLITPALAGEPELMGAAESREILSYYGFQNGSYSAGSDTNMKIDLENHAKFGVIEKDSSIVDTKEEFITAAYFTPVDIKPSAKARIEQHLPKTRDGVLKLCNMWKLKMAEGPGLRHKYAAAIRLVRKLASEKMGINVSQQAVDNHYARSVENKLQGLYNTIRELNDEEGVRLTKQYLLNPSESNKKALIDRKNKYNTTKTVAFYNILNSISENLKMVI